MGIILLFSVTDYILCSLFMILKQFSELQLIRMRAVLHIHDKTPRGVSLSNLPTEKLVSDLLNFCSNDVLIVTVCPIKREY